MTNTVQLSEELESAGLPVESVRGDGAITYKRELTQPEQTTAAAITAAHNPATGTRRKRALDAALALAQTVNGVNVTALTAQQVRNLVILLCAANGWVSPSGANWVIDITADKITQSAQGH
jgi:hypothetical protein